MLRWKICRLIGVIAITVSLGSPTVVNASDPEVERMVHKAVHDAFERLAKEGDAYGQFELGALYYQGEGTLQDYQKAAHWWRNAAQQGHVDAQYWLAALYHRGKGVPQNSRKAATLYLKAAEKGHALAQNNLGFLYRDGDGVPQDYVKAHMWWNLAASTGDSDAAEVRDRLARQMTSDQIAEAQSLAREWFREYNK